MSEIISSIPNSMMGGKHEDDRAKCRIRVKIIQGSDPQDLEHLTNKFIASLDFDQFIDIKIGRGDFSSAMVMYREE